jgi:protein-S-isoprenylcysteine O-methyltransferase Ste14
MYDTFMRLPLLIWVGGVSTLQLATLLHSISIGTETIKIIMMISVILFMLLMAATVILRTRPSSKAAGLEPRISALVGTFLMYGVVMFPMRELSPSVAVLATLLTLVGSLAAIIALYRLGRSFSIMAESRRLVTTGPYRFVRHPLYLAEEFAMIGLFLQYASVWTALIFAAQIAFQLRRMHNEEQVLSATFPEYGTYRQNTARLIPGVY